MNSNITKLKKINSSNEKCIYDTRSESQDKDRGTRRNIDDDNAASRHKKCHMKGESRCPTFDSKLNPYVFSDWLEEVHQFFSWYNTSDKVQDPLC